MGPPFKLLHQVCGSAHETFMVGGGREGAGLSGHSPISWRAPLVSGGPPHFWRQLAIIGAIPSSPRPAISAANHGCSDDEEVPETGP